MIIVKAYKAGPVVLEFVNQNLNMNLIIFWMIPKNGSQP